MPKTTRPRAGAPTVTPSGQRGLGPRLALATLAVTVALLSAHAWAQHTEPKAVLPNFDVRTEKAAVATEYRARVAARPSSAVIVDISGARKVGLAQLQADFQAVDVIESRHWAHQRSSA